MKLAKRDWVLWGLSLVLLGAGFWADAHVATLSKSMHAIVWVLLSFSVVALLWATTAGQKLRGFVQLSRGEMRKVVWPTRQETVQTTLMVMVLVTIVALLIWLIDSGLVKLMAWVTG